MKTLPQDNVTNLFLKQKAYCEEGTLFYPTELMVQVLDKLETLFNTSFKIWLHAHGILEKLCNNTNHLCKGWLTCTETVSSQTLLGMVKLFLTIIIHHALQTFK